MSSASLKVELKSQRWLWTTLTVLGLLFGALLLALGVGVSIAESGAPGIVGGGVLVSVAAWGLVFGVRALRLARARPELLLTPDSLTVLHPGLLRRPLVINRSDVEAVCIGDFIRDNAAANRTLRWQRMRQGSPMVRASDCLPDFSSVMGGRVPDVLVVLRRPFDLGTTPRRGLKSLAPETAPFNGPVRGARIKGFLGTAADRDAARHVLSGWRPVLDRPSEEILAWISPAHPRHGSR